MTTTAYLTGGQPNGTALTPTNTGLSALNGSLNSGGNTGTWQSSVAGAGAAGGLFTTVSGGNAAGASGRAAITANAQMRFKAIFTLPAALPPTELSIATLRTSLGRVGSININSTGLWFLDKNSTYVPLLTITQLNTLWSTQMKVSGQFGSGSLTASTCSIKVYNASGTVLTNAGAAVVRTNLNLTVDNFTQMDVGIAGNVIPYVLGVADLQVADGGTTELADYAPPANAQPTASVSPAKQQVVSGQTVTVIGSSADSDGTIASRLWTWVHTPGTAPTLNNATTNTVTFTQPATTGLYILQYVATDNLGLASDPALALIFLPGTAITPVQINQNVGPWVNASAGAIAVGDVTDASDSTYHQSPPADTSTDYVRYRLEPLLPFSAWSFVWRGLYSAAGGTNLSQLRLLDGATVIKTWTIAPTTSVADATPVTLSSGEIATITQFNELDLDVVYTGS